MSVVSVDCKYIEHLHASSQLIVEMHALQGVVEQAAQTILEALQSDHQLFACGNGGSAADASHFTAELVARFQRNRKAYPAMALAETASTMTAIANDFNYDQVFSRQIEAFARPGDVLCVFTTSGRSPNVLKALDAAKQIGLTTIGFYGQTGGDAVARTDISMCVPGATTALIQEGHKIILHTICETVEPYLS